MPWLDEVAWWCRMAKEYGYRGPMIFVSGQIMLPCNWVGGHG